MRLIIRWPNWVGDAVMALPLLDQIRDLTGAEHIAVMARRTTAPLVTHHPNVDELIVLEDDLSKIRGMRAGVKAIRAGGYEAGLILPPSFSSALIFYLGQVKKRIGYASDARSLMLSDPVPLTLTVEHRSTGYLKLLEKLSGRTVQQLTPDIILSDRDVASANDILFRHRISSDDSYIALSPRAVALSRRWGVENYGALARKLVEETGYKIVLIGTASDREAGEGVAEYSPDAVVNLCGQTDLMVAAAVLSKGKLFIGNDSGLAHLAGAAKSPLVVLSGADNPTETSPISSDKTVLVKEISCIGCVKNSCPLSGEKFMRCMKQITVDEVADAAFKWLRA